MRIMSECLDKWLQTVVIATVLHYFLRKCPQLLLIRKLAIDNKEGCLQEG